MVHSYEEGLERGSYSTVVGEALGDFSTTLTVYHFSAFCSFLSLSSSF